LASPTFVGITTIEHKNVFTKMQEETKIEYCGTFALSA
jgi:hypothetical protein